ncbi:hypothetical protein B0T11DRAFT_288843 [Plectosphaerella cucumerina]|uniref:Uncharacterized protein n=1 Tax=Plectosphaerella cucumerina TaxID=40658 RepID=A0A8K0T596_9PEZI|nr:hypothetical protein B0T11DRAFT_288843 [Plectosphaerella cucumerina]
MNDVQHSRDGGGRGGRYRRERSPPTNDMYPSAEDIEAQNPGHISDMAVQDAMMAHSIHQTRAGLPSQQDQSPTQRNRYPPAAGAMAGSRACPPSGPLSHQQQPPSYPGPPPPNEPNFEEGPGGRAGGPPRRRTARNARRLSGASDGGAEPGPRPAHSPPRGPDPDQAPRESRAQHHPVSPGRRLAEPAVSSPGRVSSPSITQSVLLPLETKMREYYEHMEEEQKRMRQLDEEIRALQDQRHQAEERFIDAKSKHDEYERQHMDVERALRGDFPPRQQQQQQPIQQSQQPPQPVAPSPSWTMTRAPSMDSFDERPTSGRSGGGNPKGRSRFRMSLFRS